MKRILTLTLALAAAWPVAAMAGPQPPDVPTAIAVTDGSKAYLVVHATGVQIYTCDGTAWQFNGPRADLSDDRGTLVGRHFGGPTWEARDGSRAVGKRVAGVTVDPTAIDWLKLSATSTPGADGDRFTGTKWIQRVATTGGLIPPAGACNTGAAGTIEEVPYTADYVFWR